MRLWSLHPRYLDAKGLVALWREGLLAKNVLEGKTTGYKKHPQLDRFKKTADSKQYICLYLHAVLAEAEHRGYTFDASKLPSKITLPKLRVTQGQIDYEITHLKKKLLQRDTKKLTEIKKIEKILAHPLFLVVEGDVESWEIV